MDVTKARQGLVVDRSVGGESITARQNPCPGDPFCAKQLELVDVLVPTADVDPGTQAPITVETANHANLIDPLDPDRCDSNRTGCPGRSGTVGYCGDVHVVPQWATDQGRDVCFNIALVPPNRKQTDFILPAPNQEGDLDVEVFIEMDATGDEGNRTASITRTISYLEGGTDNPDQPNGNGDDDPLQQVSRTLVLGIIFLLIAIGAGVAS